MHDGCGLYLTLFVRKKGKWTIRYMVNRKAKEMSLGIYPEVCLSDARKRHFKVPIKNENGIHSIEAQLKTQSIL